MSNEEAIEWLNFIKEWLVGGNEPSLFDEKESTAIDMAIEALNEKMAEEKCYSEYLTNKEEEQ